MPLEGEIVRLREIRESDLPMFVRLRNDLATQAWSRTLPPDYTIEMIRRRYWDRDFSYRRDQGLFVVEMKQDDEVAGMVSYSDVIDRMEATWGIAIERHLWGTGAGFDAGDTLLRFLFEELGLRVVRLYTQTGNERAVAAFAKLGFREAKRVPGAVFKGGDHADNLTMDLLREEWYALHPGLEDRLNDPFRS
ncbi:MAG TPA: GNAT family protein [Acidimicrobiia bacterium]|nr:GNAT family protein [Acidimicrobiia bacterium]